MATSTYREWRERADAYLRQTQPESDRWCLSEVLAMLRHSLNGQLLWNEAQSNGFFERVAA